MSVSYASVMPCLTLLRGCIAGDVLSLGDTQVFKQRHYWSMELGNVVCLGISTVRFRSNAFRCRNYPSQPESCAGLHTPSALSCS